LFGISRDQGLYFLDEKGGPDEYVGNTASSNYNYYTGPDRIRGFDIQKEGRRDWGYVGVLRRDYYYYYGYSLSYEIQRVNLGSGQVTNTYSFSNYPDMVDFTILDTAAVPEPVTVAGLALGLGFVARKRRRK
jgi:hypothetical protein